MTFYKEKIQKQLKKTLENFKKTQNRSWKTQQIKKQGKVARIFKPRDSFQQKNKAYQTCQEPQVLNFFNIININSESVRNPSNQLSYLQNNFFYKSIKKIQVKQNYIVLSLKDSGLLLTQIQATIAKYKQDECLELQSIGWMLQNLSKKIDMTAIQQESQVSITNQTFQLLDSIGQKPFVCKIFSEKIIISKALLELQGYDSEEFIIESMKYKFPFFECISCQSYPKIVQTEIQFYSVLLDLLNEDIPLCYFLESAYSTFFDTITSKNNKEYRCKMSLSMPIPLVELMKVEQIVETTEKVFESKFKLFNEKFKKYRHEIWQKQNQTLQHLINLPKNYLPSQKQKTANYQDVIQADHFDKKIEEDDRRSQTFSNNKNNHTTSEIKQHQEISFE